MNTNELFIDGYKLPKPLITDELITLFSQTKNGSKEARDKLIIHNIRLVLYEVKHKFKNVNYDKKDLVSIGNLGLVKAIETYDISKEIKFTTYAVTCIDNEILMFLRKLKKDDNVYSLNKVFHNKDGDEFKLEDYISDDRDFTEEIEIAENYKIIREIVKVLPDRDREIILLYFGFYNNRIYTQSEIADKMGLSYVSRLIIKIINRISETLESKGIIELHSNKSDIRKERKGKMPKLQTIYQYFKNYTKEQVDEMLTKLTEEEKALVTLRYGEDLNNPVAARLSKEQSNKFYGTLIPKMKRLLSNPTGERKPRKSIQKKETIQHSTIGKVEQTSNN